MWKQWSQESCAACGLQAWRAIDKGQSLELNFVDGEPTLQCACDGLIYAVEAIDTFPGRLSNVTEGGGWQRLRACWRCGTTWTYVSLAAMVPELAYAAVVEQPQAEIMGPCGACGHDELWQIEMREHGPFLPQSLMLDDQTAGSLQLRVCVRCAHADWYAVQLALSDRLPFSRSTCDCGGDRWISSLLKDGGEKMPVIWLDHPHGWFQAEICMLCAKILWRVSELTRFEATVEKPCSGCGHTQQLHVNKLSERGVMGRVAFSPVIDGMHGRGRFDIFICASCGQVEWFARELQDLKERPGIIKVHHRGVQSGPYR
jgi:hypothetical protein